MYEKIKAHLIDDWKQAWKFLSVWLALIMMGLDVAGDSLPMIKEYLPDGWVKYAAGAIILARVIKQTKEKK